MPAIPGIIVFYGLFVFLISRFIGYREAPITITQIALIFACKVAMGCLYGYIFLHYYHGDDTWAYHNDSLDEYNKLIHNPVRFLKDFGPASAFGATDNLRQALHYYMNDLEYWTMVKLLAIFNIFSRGNYYVNTVFFNFILFWGPYMLFLLLVKLFPDKKRPLLITVFFLLPLVFWLSGIRADGLLLLFIALLLRHFYRWLYEKKNLSLLVCLLAMAGLFLFRSLWLVVLLPALLSWMLVVRFNKRPLIAFGAVYGILLTVFFGSTLLSPRQNLPALVVQKQQEFMELKGNTVFELQPLEPDFTSFVTVLPQAFSHSFFRPYVWEATGWLQLVSALEVILFWGLVVLAIWRRDRRWKDCLTHPLLLLFLVYAVSLNILIGYMVPFPGAIERYRAIPLLLLCVTGVILTNWGKRTNKTIY